ncbi:MAG: NADH-quinone oxidoreductase subunit M [Phycisphaerales bacterium]|nr:NADH-quinone oxidoreductase subunit M [Phycisphaerales bacterium]
MIDETIQSGFNWTLTTLIFSPLMGVAMVLTLHRDDHSRIRLMALLASLTTLALAVITAFEFRSAAVQTSGNGWALYHLQGDLAWLDPDGPIDVRYHVGVDTISLWLVLLTAFLTPLAVWASFSGIRERVREYFALLLLLETAMLGVFCSMDLLLFFVFFEFTLIPLFFIIGIWGGAERRRAAAKFFIFTVAGSVLTFGGVLFVAYYVYSSAVAYGLPDAKFTMSIKDLIAAGRAGRIPADVQWWLFIAFAAGFAVKVPFFPLHTWLPLAHTEAPTAGSAILAGVLLKLGTYGFVRLCVAMLPDATYAFAPFMAVLAIVGILYGAFCAWAQTDVKKLVAYSSVSHLGFCMLGLFSLKLAGATGSIIYMLNHGLSTAALFLIVGMVYERYHTRDMDKIGGLARTMPWMAFFLIFFTLASIGLPGLNGFVGEILVLLGTAYSDQPRTSPDDLGVGPLGFAYAIPAALGIIFGAVYMLSMCQKVLFGPRREPPHTPDASTGLTPDLNGRERAILFPLAVACLLIGVYPRPLIDSLHPAISVNVFQLYYMPSSTPHGLELMVDETAAAAPSADTPAIRGNSSILPEPA